MTNEIVKYDEHVYCLVAAGIISAGDIDPSYQEYVSKWLPRWEDAEPLTYEAWHEAHCRYEALNAEIDALNVNFELWYWKDTPEGRDFLRLSREIEAFEIELGY